MKHHIGMLTLINRSMSDTRHTFNHKRRCYIMFYHNFNEIYTSNVQEIHGTILNSSNSSPIQTCINLRKQKGIMRLPALVMPMPLSMMERVLLALSGTSLMKSSGCPSSLLLSVKLSNRILSKAFKNHIQKHS